MFQNELQSRIEDLKQQIAAFPPGSITKKKINGKDLSSLDRGQKEKRKIHSNDRSGNSSTTD